MFEIYVGIIQEGKERTSTACTTQWGTINQDVTKFCGLFAQVTSVPKSRWTEDKYIEEAVELVKLEGKGKRLGKKFIFDGCWHMLKEAPKWKGGCGYVRDQPKLKVADLKYELRHMWTEQKLPRMRNMLQMLSLSLSRSML